MNQWEIGFQAKKMHVLSGETSLKMSHILWTVEEMMPFCRKMSTKETRKDKHEGSSSQERDVYLFSTWNAGMDGVCKA